MIKGMTYSFHLALFLTIFGSIFAGFSDGLVAWYPLDGNALDASRGGNHGTIKGAVPDTDRFGKPNGCFHFDGVNDRIVIGNVELVTGNQMSIQAWFKTDSPFYYARPLVTKMFKSAAYYLGGSYYEDDRIEFFVNSVNSSAPSDNIVNDGKWHHAVGVYDGQQVRLFVDGRLQQIGTEYNWNINIANEPLCIGGYEYPDDREDPSDYSGNIDDVRIWNRPLNQAEILELFTLPEDHPKSLKLIRPNGNEAFNALIDYDITWEAVGDIQNVLLEFSSDGGNTWSEIDVVPNTGSYRWNVSYVNSSTGLIGISDSQNPVIHDQSASYFTITTISCLEMLVGDLNGDCLVDLSDLALMAENWLRGGYFRIYKNNLDSDPGWSVEGPWAFGQPTGGGGTEKGNPDPTSGKTGSSVFGVNLSGDYMVALGGPYSLMTGPFNCRSFHDLKLKFVRWLNTDGPNYVLCTVDVSSNGSTWTTVWQNDSVVTENNWIPVEYDVSAVADNQETVYFRWTYKILHERAYPYSGWNIDDIELYGKR